MRRGKPPGGPWYGESGFLGVKFDIPQNGSPATRHFGFIELTVNDATPDDEIVKISIGTAFWNDVPGEAVHIPGSPIPEPAGLGALALGAAGLVAVRRRKEKSS